jgi:hypothetical protein
MIVTGFTGIIHDELLSPQLQRNLALAGLSSEALSLLQRRCSEQEFHAEAVLWRAGESVSWVFFPVCEN